MTANLRREEIARTPQTETGKRDHDDAWSSDPSVNEWTMNHEGNRPESCRGCRKIAAIEDEARSQDTATARIAALRDIVKSLVRRADGYTPKWAGDHRTYELHIEERFIAKARAVLSGETRTGGET